MHNHRRTVMVAAWGEKEGKTEMTCRFFKN